MPYSDAQSFNIDLSINDVSSDTIYKGEPLVMHVSISNAFASYGMEWNAELDSHLESIKSQLDAELITYEIYKQDSLESEQTRRSIEPVIIGTERRSWYEIIEIIVSVNQDSVVAWTFTPLGYSEENTIITVNGESYYFARFGIAPEATMSLAPGQFSIVAKINEVESASSDLLILPGEMPESLVSSDDHKMRLGIYYLEENKAGAALNYAKSILETNPNSIDGLVLSGEAYLLMDVHDLALNAFEQAMEEWTKQYPDAIDPPEYLMSMIEYLKDK